MPPSDQPERETHRAGRGGRSHSSNADIEQIFGEVMPSLGPDERDRSDSAAQRDNDRWLRDNVPPHHHR